MVDRTRGLFDADKAGLWMVAEDAERPFQLAAARGIGDDFQAVVRSLSLSSTAVGVQATINRRTYVVHDANSDPSIGRMSEIYVREGIRTACLVPLVSGDRAVGVLGLYHTRDHEWLRIEGDDALVGITEYAASELGDVVFVELPETGAQLDAAQTFGVIESVKTASDLYSPAAGEVLATNQRRTQRSY